MSKSFTLLTLFLAFISTINAQIPTNQDCLGAIPICEPIYTTTDAYLGVGNYFNEFGPGTCQLNGELNSVWLKFSVVASGDLAFTIYPTSNMDYDWALYNLTNDSCADIAVNGSLLASCNSSEYAVTGISAFGVGNWNSYGPTNAFNYLLPVAAGELYYLQINNYYGVSGGFTIDFTPSTAILFECDSVLIGAAQTSLCEKFCTDFTDQSTNNPTSWLWQFPGGIPSSSVDQNPVNICYSNPGIYDITLITTNAAGVDTLTLTDYITVYPSPAFPVITQAGYTLTSSTAASYQWQFNAIDIPGATNQSYDVPQTGYYTVVIADQNSCISSTTIYVLIDGIDEASDNGSISIYPNPSNGSFIMEHDNVKNPGNGTELIIEIESLLGQVVYSEPIMMTSNHWKQEIDLRDIAEGIYMLSVSAARGNSPGKAVSINKMIVVTK